MKAVYPLWQRDRAENVAELLGLGYKCLVKAIDNRFLPKKLLGKIIDDSIIAEMKKYGIDVCGENGEYHTLVVDGSIFQKPLSYTLGKVLDFGDISVVEID